MKRGRVLIRRRRRWRRRRRHPIWLEESSKLQSWARSIKFAVFWARVKPHRVCEHLCEREEKRREEKRRDWCVCIEVVVNGFLRNSLFSLIPVSKWGSFARKSCDLCGVLVGCCCCCDRRYDRGFAQKLRSLRCVRVSSSLLRPKLRSRFCAKVATFVLYSCVCVLLLLLRSNLRSRFCAKLLIFCVVVAVVRACLSFLI